MLVSQMGSSEVFAQPRIVTDLGDCYFYHSMEIPGYGHVDGEWDLRPGIDEYLGGVAFQGKRVLEIGTASGFVCFHMEKQGAEVIAYDLSERHLPDVVPFTQYDHDAFLLDYKAHVHKINNAYWLCHRVYNSHARVVYGSVYAIPQEIGPVDISTFGCVLLHVRDPFLALTNAARLTRKTLIVTEIVLTVRSPLERFCLTKSGPWMRFYPEFSKCEPRETWWLFSPQIIQKFLGVLGFEETEVTHHVQQHKDRKARLFTVVGYRTRNMKEG